MSIKEEIILKLFKIKDYKLKSIQEGEDLVLNLERISPSICKISKSPCTIHKTRILCMTISNKFRNRFNRNIGYGYRKY